MRPLLPLLALPIFLTACVDTDASVFVEPTIESPTATVGANPIGVMVNGKFTFKLHLGPRAAGPAQVNLGAFSILDSEQTAAITPIQLGSTEIQFPLTVDLDSDVSAVLSFDLGNKLLPFETMGTAKGQLCDPAGLIIGGTIEDSLRGGSTPFFSPIIHPTSCK